MRKRSLLLALLVGLVLPAGAGAQAQTLGSPLTQAPNWSAGCETELDFFDEGPTAQGEYSFRQTNRDCTWFTPQSVPSNGRVRVVRIRAGRNPTQIRFVVARQLQGQGGPAGGGCCFFVAEYPPAPQPPLTLTPNAINEFATDIPVERNTSERTGIVTADFLGFSGVPNTGEIPLFDASPPVGPQGNSTLSGPTSASFYYPRLGAQPSDSQGGRNPKGIPRVEVLLQYGFAPAGSPGGGAGGANPPPPNPGGGPQPAPGGAQPGPGAAPAPVVVVPQAQPPALRRTALRVVANRALLDLVCRGSAACGGTVELLARSAARQGSPPVSSAAATAKPASYGRARYSIVAGRSERVRVKLNARGRKLLRKRRTVRLALRVSPSGSADGTTARITLKRPAKRG